MTDDAVSQLIQQTYRQPFRPVEIKAEKPADRPSDDPAEDFIWLLARKFTDSPEEAEAAVREVKTDIQGCAARGKYAPPNENGVVERIAWRRLLNFLQNKI